MATPQDGKNAEQEQGAKREVVDQQLIKALAHPVRAQALSILNERVASPNEIAKELKQGVGHVSYHINVLKQCECIELVGTEPRRGEADDYQPRRRVAEAVDRPRPVVLAAVALGRVGRGCLAPPDQPRAAAADVDLGRQRGEVPLTLGGGGCRPVA